MVMDKGENKEAYGTEIAVINIKLDYLTGSFEKFDQKISQNYINREEFAILVGKLEALQQEVVPLKKFVYGIITIICAAVIGAILKVVIS